MHFLVDNQSRDLVLMKIYPDGKFEEWTREFINATDSAEQLPEISSLQLDIYYNHLQQTANQCRTYGKAFNSARCVWVAMVFQQWLTPDALATWAEATAWALWPDYFGRQFCWHKIEPEEIKP